MKKSHRISPYLCDANVFGAKSAIALPVMISEEDKYPWGVLYILSKKRLTVALCQDIIATLNGEGDTIETLERLLDRQRHGHAFSLAD